MKIAQDLTELIGNTPLLRFSNYEKLHGLKAKLIGKLEYKNPAGSVKDRAALAMIQAAEREGKLKPGAVIIEPTSGNTGIGLACVAAARGYRVVLTMPETMSAERRRLLAAYGAELVLTDGARGMTGAIEKARELLSETENAFMPGQFTNQSNADAHEIATGPEIWADTGGAIDIFVAGVGSGGTISGAGNFLKSKNPHIHIIAVEPADSRVLSGGSPGAHALQGIGAGFVPEIFDWAVCDEVFTVTKDEAFTAAREIARCEGLLIGISSGAAVHAATAAAERHDSGGKTIVVIIPDSGERYLSTELFG